MSAFDLDPRLAADSAFVADGPLSQVRLMDDTRFPWLLLVPRVPGAVEWIDLDGNQQRLLLAEINRTSQLLRAVAGVEKLNIGALGTWSRNCTSTWSAGTAAMRPGPARYGAMAARSGTPRMRWRQLPRSGVHG